MKKSWPVGTLVQDLDTPCLVVDLATLERNIEAMAKIVRGTKARLRPHSKSHKTPYIAHRQIAAGACGVCCAKLGEAEVMIEGGIPDVLITSPVVGPGKIVRLAALSRQAKVSVVADSPVMFQAMNDALGSVGGQVGIFIEVDIGQGRCGVRNSDQAVALAKDIGRYQNLKLEGIQGYQGLLQQLKSYDERMGFAKKALAILQSTADAVSKTGIEIKTLTGGGSGSSQIDIDLGGYTELQAGSYVFMDTKYLGVEWNSRGEKIPFESSLYVLSSVVSKPTQDLAVIDAGWKSLSSDSGPPAIIEPIAEEFLFGGDEHGKIRLNADGRSIRPGDKVKVRPSHCDTTVNLYDELIGVRNGAVESVWRMTGRGRSD